MAQEWTMKEIAHIRSDFPGKFGIPRQSGLVAELQAKIVFAPEFRDANALRGMEDFSHLWLIWAFSANAGRWSATVRPPRLGGDARMGVFATRSPFRPNELGLSCVKLVGIEQTEDCGTVLHVAGADLMDGTPIFDIKPYLPFVDSHPEAVGGFADRKKDYALAVEDPDALLHALTEEQQAALRGVLAHDPRPSYQDDPERLYGMAFGGYEVKFTVSDGVLTVRNLKKEG